MSKKMHAFAPGRTEIAGNHVDHQHGQAVTGSLKQGIDAQVEFNDSNIINVISEGFDPFELNISYLKEGDYDKKENEFTSKALVAGVVQAFLDRGYDIKGFDVKMTSDIPSGMGLSSSAAYELLFGVILNEAFAKGEVSKMELAQIGQFAESEFYGKPCGLLDQTAISYGGIICIDFKDPKNLIVEPIDFNFKEEGIAAILVDSGAEHGDISNLYAEIPGDMKKIASVLGVDYLGEASVVDFCKNIMLANEVTSDTATLRGIHYYHEMILTNERIKAMKAGDAETFMRLTGFSGSSSARYLQNVSVSDENQQAQVANGIVDLALDYVCEYDMTKRGNARIHGGGFGGCIQVFLRLEQVDAFLACIEEIYGEQRAQEIEITNTGAYAKFID